MWRNRKYIKRQLTLHKLGIDINSDIQKYYNIFCDVVGNINDYTEIKNYAGIHEVFDTICWCKNNSIVFKLYTKEKILYVDNFIIWNKCIMKFKCFKIDHNEKINIISSFFEYFLKIEVGNVNPIPLNI